MSNKRITDLSELTNPTTDDVFPVVDIATNTTTKVQLGNLPVPTSVTTALATKQDTLVSGTNIKTVNSTSLVGSGNVAVQETLVSGTNIKTINSTSLLGSGNITIAANPSGVAGAIQFSNGSAFASDAANLFWDDTNNRLGVGTNSPTSPLTVIGASQFGNASGSGNIETFDGFYSYSFGKNTSIYNPNSNYTRIFMASSQTFIDNASGNYQFRSAGDTVLNLQSGNLALGNSSTTPTARLQVKGSGSTSATTSLLVQNSAGTAAMTVSDNLQTTFGSSINGTNLFFSGVLCAQYIGTVGNTFTVMQSNASNGNARFYNFVSVGKTTDPVASAALEVVSTTRGFLPPVMTTTQKNAIATPASGLVVYDTTTNKLCCYNGSTWNDLF